MWFCTDFVHPYERLVEISPEGARVLGTGRHVKRPGRSYHVVDLRRQRVDVNSQMILTRDGTDARVSVTVDVRVSDPVRYLMEHAAPHDAVYLAVQVALREVVAALDIEEVLARGFSLDGHMDAIMRAADEVGLRVLDAVIKDVGASYEVEAAIAASVIEKATAKARLEQARAEAAATRVRANTVKVYEEHPFLARLRMLEALPDGTKLVIRADDDQPASLDSAPRKSSN